MKLYATVSSERATKGQGGNDHILTVYTAEIAGERQEIMSVAIVNCVQDYYAVTIKTPEGVQKYMKVSKGEKQKSERWCATCGIRKQTEKYCEYCKPTK